MVKPHLFTLPMDSSGLCGYCGKDCLDEIHVDIETLMRLQAEEAERTDIQSER